MDKNLYDLPPEELHDVPTVCGSLRQAADALRDDQEFLLAGDVFDKDQIDGLPRPQVGGDPGLRDGAPSDRVQDVLLVLIATRWSRSRCKRPSFGAASFLLRQSLKPVG